MVKNKVFAPLFGLLAAAALTALILALYALLMTYGKVGDKNIAAVVMAGLSTALVAGGFLTGRLAGSRGMVWGALTGLLYLAAMVALGAFTVPGYALGSKTAVCALLCLCCGSLGGVLGVNTGGK